MQNTLTRRNFVAASALAAAGAAAGLKQAKAITTDDVEGWDLECDVLVAGAGTGGLPAAVAAADAGAEVILIEKKDWCGGQLRRCGGGVAGAGTQVQEALGVEDNADDFYEYWMAMQEGLADPDIVRAICDNSAAYIDWLIDDLGGQPVEEWGFSEGIEGGLVYSGEPGLNIGTQPENFENLGMTPVARCHWFSPNPDDPIIGEPEKVVCPNPGGTALYKLFIDRLTEHGVEPMTETSLVRLVTAPGTNEVRGAIVQGPDGEIAIKARKGVIVATGNYNSNHEMFLNYTGVDFTTIEGMGNGIGIDLPDDNDGTGINAMLALGAQLVYPASGVYQNEDGTWMGWSFMSGGVRLNPQAQVVDVFGEVIPRLYVTSNAGGCQIIKSYHCCGVNVLRHGYLGKVAGEGAAVLEAWE